MQVISQPLGGCNHSFCPLPRSQNVTSEHADVALNILQDFPSSTFDRYESPFFLEEWVALPASTKIYPSALVIFIPTNGIWWSPMTFRWVDPFHHPQPQVLKAAVLRAMCCAVLQNWHGPPPGRCQGCRVVPHIFLAFSWSEMDRFTIKQAGFRMVLSQQKSGYVLFGWQNSPIFVQNGQSCESSLLKDPHSSHFFSQWDGWEPAGNHHES